MIVLWIHANYYFRPTIWWKAIQIQLQTEKLSNAKSCGFSCTLEIRWLYLQYNGWNRITRYFYASNKVTHLLSGGACREQYEATY